MIRLPQALQKRVHAGATLAKSAVKVGSQVIGGRIAEARLPRDFSPQASDEFVAAVYFSSEGDSAYQLEQWLWPFERLAQRLTETGYSSVPFGIFVRSANVAKRIRPLTNLPVRFSRLSNGLDEFMTSPSLRAVFYVNQATGNFQALKFPVPAHVHLSHGESEKISMISNQLKAYDFVFTAGDAARRRIGATLFDLPDSRMIDVGRPQLDRPRSVPAEWHDFDAANPDGPTVFYAPTWEGDSNAMAYGTLTSNGTTLVNSMLNGGYRVIFRAHPRTGILRTDFARALEDVKSIVKEHPRGFLDETPSVSWQFEAADVALAEMSSVAFDWLATCKPLVMIPPSNQEAEVLPGGLIDRCHSVAPGDEGTIADKLNAVASGTGGSEARAIASDYLGDTVPGRQIQRFVAASEQVVNGRDAEVRSRADV